VDLSFRLLRGWWIVVITGVLALLFLVSLTPKDVGFLAMQLPHSPAGNSVFQLTTFLGDGLFTILICVFLALKVSYRKAMTLLSGYLLAAFCVQLVKLYILADMPRPVMWFELNGIALVVPDGLKPHRWNSFPSGHSASVAGLTLFLASLSPRRTLHILLGFIALLVGYSRIYLFMHFPVDVACGLSIGAITMWITAWGANRQFIKYQPAWAEKSFFAK